MRQYRNIWFPDDDGTLTKALKARLDSEPVYRGDRLEEALKYVKRFDLAVDCGANVGMWTVELAKRFKHVIAFEADPMNAECLTRNTAQLKNVSVINQALGETPGRAALDRRKGHFSSHITAGDAVEMKSLNYYSVIEVCDYLKVHVNGYELPVLRGAADFLKRCRPVLTVVLKPKLAAYDTAPEDIIAWLDAHDYTLAGGQKPYRIFIPRG